MGESMVIRILDREKVILNLTAWDFRPGAAAIRTR